MIDRTPLVDVYVAQAVQTTEIYLYVGIWLYVFVIMSATFMDGLDDHSVFDPWLPFWLVVGWPVFLAKVFFGGGWHQ